MKRRVPLNRRQFITGVAAGGSTLTVAGCLQSIPGTDSNADEGGDTGDDTGGMDDDEATTATTTTTPPSDTDGAFASIGYCEGFAVDEYVRLDGTGRPLLYTFEYPQTWEVIRDVEVSTVYTVILEWETEEGDERYSANLQGLNHFEPTDPDDIGYGDLVEQGWNEIEIAFKGDRFQFVTSPYSEDSITMQALGSLPFEGDGQRTRHIVSFQLGLDDRPCPDTIPGMFDRVVSSIEPNPATTFARKEPDDHIRDS